MASPPAPTSRIWFDEIRERNTEPDWGWAELFEHLCRPRQFVHVHLPHSPMVGGLNRRLCHESQCIVGTSESTGHIGNTEAVPPNEFCATTLAAGSAQMHFHRFRPS